MLENMSAIIFDLDGTLVDSMWIWMEVDEQYMEKYGLTAPETFHKDIEGKSYTETAQYFLDSFPQLSCTLHDVQQEWIEMTKDLYATKVLLKQGAREFLETMYDRQIQLGIATSNSRELVEIVLEALHIRKYFSSVRTSCEVAAGKPAPDVYLKVAEDLQTEPTNCLVFEDVPRGIEAGKNAGMKVCALDDECSRACNQEKRRLADYFIHNYDEIKNCTFERCGV